MTKPGNLKKLRSQSLNVRIYKLKTRCASGGVHSSVPTATSIETSENKTNKNLRLCELGYFKIMIQCAWGNTMMSGSWQKSRSTSSCLLYQSESRTKIMPSLYVMATCRASYDAQTFPIYLLSRASCRAGDR